MPVATLESAYGIQKTVYYGYRAWGPNWPFAPTWKPGSSDGFLADVDGNGNHFDPNKLLIDPYALEVSHDPLSPGQMDGTIYASGPDKRSIDTGQQASKSILLTPDNFSTGTKPIRPLKDDIIYEVHLRGLTEDDPQTAQVLRGTFAGAGQKAAYLRSLGVTAVEFLPVQETQNDTNDMVASTNGDNYWGYATDNYFAPDRHYAHDRSPGGPTREFKSMVKAFHDQGLKVFIDVVYNHTGEGGVYGSDMSGDTATLLSWRGLDNATYYELTADHRFPYDNTGVGGNFNTANPVVRNEILNSLSYWTNTMGVDGFRFDLAAVLGNSCMTACFTFDKFEPNNVLNRAVRELPVRLAGGGSGVDLIAEPWAIGPGTYQLGNFPSGWAEWNGKYRDTLRQAQDKLGVVTMTPSMLATRFAGSSDLFGDDGRKPWHSINFMVAHDGFTLRDVYSYDAKNNGQAWPFGPSDGGEDNNNSWDQGGDATLQRQQARDGLALLMLSAGVPMITGGDEMYRTQYGNNNTYNLDSDKNWLDYSNATTFPHFFTYSKRLMAFRAAHPALRPADFFRGADHNGNGLKDLTWLTDRGTEADATYMDNDNNHFLAYRIDGSEYGDSLQSIYVAYNSWSETVTTTLPPTLPGKQWYRISDTAAWLEDHDNFNAPGNEEPLGDAAYTLAPRSVVLLGER